jgi:hypothetical protein
LLLYKLKKVNYIFDTRSLFIDESTLNGTILKDGLNYKMWKYFEKKILQNSYKTTAVSLKQKEYYEMIFPDVNIELIPCYIMPIEKIDNGEQLNLRKRIGFYKQDIVICYYGSLDNGWNNIDMYSAFFKECIELNYKVLVISQNYNNIINDNRLKNENIILLNTNNLDNVELLQYLQVADYGVVLMKKSADWETRLSVKFVEYLNAGLQVIVGEYVGEAVRYAKKEFQERSIVYSDVKDISKLNTKGFYTNERTDILFGHKNLRKVVN